MIFISSALYQSKAIIPQSVHLTVHIFKDLIFIIIHVVGPVFYLNALLIKLFSSSIHFKTLHIQKCQYFESDKRHLPRKSVKKMKTDLRRKLTIPFGELK
jgi:hypothetical protein